MPARGPRRSWPAWCGGGCTGRFARRRIEEYRALSPAPERLIRLSDNPKHWLNRAENKRSLADDMRDARAKERMLRMALDYEKIAARRTASSQRPTSVTA